MRVFECSDLTGQMLVFWIGGRLQRMRGSRTWWFDCCFSTVHFKHRSTKCLQLEQISK